MSQGGFYRHFKDKNDILVAALEEPLAELHAVIDPLGDPGAVTVVDREAIMAIHTAFFRVYAENRRVTRVLREAAALQEPGLAELWLDIRSRYLSRIERWLRGLQAAGTLRAPDVVLLAEALGAVLDQLAYTRLGLAEADPTPTEIEALGAVTARLWVAAVRAD
jgi:AcrR family transcriptional regulator